MRRLHASAAVEATLRSGGLKALLLNTVRRHPHARLRLAPHMDAAIGERALIPMPRPAAQPDGEGLHAGGTALPGGHLPRGGDLRHH
jgi:hypothetical protein